MYKRQGEGLKSAAAALPRKRGTDKPAGGAAAGGAGGGEGPKIIIETSSKGRKTVTIIKGLHAFEGVKLKDAAKTLGKKCAASASVKTAPSGEDFVEVQGDWAYEAPQWLVDMFKVPKGAIYGVDEDGKKFKALD